MRLIACICLLLINALAIGAEATAEPARIVGVCHLAQNPADPPRTAVNGIAPLLEATDYLTKFERKKIAGTGKASILKQPDHGVLIDEGGGYYYFEPAPHYLGKDEATILVEIAGMKVWMRYFFHVLDSRPDDYDREKHCPTYKWRIPNA